MKSFIRSVSAAFAAVAFVSIAGAEPVNVADFGAVADGKTDCTAVIDKFLDDRGGHKDSVIRDNAGSALKSLDQVVISLPD